ncbi:MAG: hypothetical protein QG673_796 [Pseudomonadota bacterium]|nr:hypothetical protein [Pseudomonadota bacterium]
MKAFQNKIFILKWFILTIFSLILINPVNAKGINSVTTTPCGQLADGTNSCIIFITDKTYKGNLDGYSGADNTCNSRAAIQYPNLVNSGIKFKALLGFNNATKAGTKYYQAADGVTLIATATGGNLTEVLVNPITPWYVSSSTFWLGMKAGITTDGKYYNCEYFTKQDHQRSKNQLHHPNHGHIGISGECYGSKCSQTGFDSNGMGWDIDDNNDGGDSCEHSHHLACVAQ